MQVTQQQDPPQLSMAGEVDIEATSELQAAARRVLAALAAGDRLAIDLSAVTFIDSSGLGALISVRNAAIAAERELVLVNLPAPVTRLFQLTGLSQAFTVE